MGCAKNEVDSAHMSEKLRAAGYAIADDPEQADAIIVNTCSFIQAATEESIDAILEATQMDKGPDAKIPVIVAGCMPARYGEELEPEFPEVASFVPCSKEDDIVAIVDALFEHDPKSGSSRPEAGLPYSGNNGSALSGPSAYVKISDGCDRFCAYCTIPFIRGRYHSFPYEDIRAEVAMRIEQGGREIVLIAQDTGRWGSDFEQPSSLAQLVSRLAEEFPDTWFRLLYIQPEGVTDDLIEACANHANVCNYFDIPFQHVVPSILKAMNRRGSRDDYLDLLERILKRIPDAALRTTLIAGFPGESDDDFEELCDFVEDAPLDYIGVFAYSREEGTRAFDYDGQIEEEEKAYRAQRIRDIADAASSARIAERIGSEADVLVCGCEEDGQLFGRAMCQAPDVDGVTFVDGGAIGDIIHVRIVDTLMYEMEGELLK